MSEHVRRHSVRSARAWLLAAIAGALIACAGAEPGYADERALAVQDTLWLVAAGDGTVARSSGLTALTRQGPGRYEARFVQDVRGCAYTATVADPGNGLVYAPGLAFTASGHLSADGVYVETKNLAGGLTDLPFQLTVSCAGSGREDAVVDGSRLVRGSARAVERVGPGRYTVRFDRDVFGCAATATIGDPGAGQVYSPGLAFAAADPSDATTVSVQTVDVGGESADFPFHLALNCTRGSDALVTPSALVGEDGSLTGGHGALSATRIDTGRYEVRFPVDMRFCAYSANIDDPLRRGMVFAATGHASPDGVYVETKNLGGGLTDLPFQLSVDCSTRPLADEGVSLLSLNLEGTDSTDGPWEGRYARVGGWMGATGLIPDALLLQETPGRKCWYAGGCEPYDYQSVFTLIRAIKAATGVQYRVAFLSTGDPVEGGRLYQGRAVVYNPVRLRNLTPRQPWPPIDWPSALGSEMVAHASLPCSRPAAGMEQDCSFVDTDVRPERTYWGPYWGMAGVAFGRFALAEHEQHTALVDLYSVHATIIPGSHWVPDLAPISDAVDWLEQVAPPSGTRLLPPLLSGDFNTSVNWMQREVAGTQRLAKFEIAAYSPLPAPPPPPLPKPDPDLIGTLVGERANYPARFAAKAVVNRFLPETGEGSCRAPEQCWSDHRAEYVELVTTAQDAPPTPAPPQVPDVVGTPLGEAAATLRASGYAVKWSYIPDRTCDHIGDVVSQSPAAGVRFFLGDAVTLRIGAPPTSGCR
jgi:hypothetical protein